MADIYAFNPFTANLDKTFSGTAVAVWGTLIGTLSNQTDLQTSLGVLQVSMSAVAPLQFESTGKSISIINVGVAADGYLTSSQYLALGAAQSHSALAGLDYATAAHTGFQQSISVVTPITLTGQTISSIAVSATTDGHLTSTQYLNMPTGSTGTLSTTATGLSIIGGAGAVLGTNCVIYLSSGALATSTTGIYIAGASTSLIGVGANINISTASAAAPGLLSAADWVVFNDKQTSIGALAPITLTGTSVGITNVSATVDGYLTSTQFLNMPTGTSTGNLSTTATGLSIIGGTNAILGTGCTISISAGALATSTASIHIAGGSTSVIGTGVSLDIDTVSTTVDGILTSTQYLALGGAQSHSALQGLDYATAAHTGFQASISAVAPITLTGNTVSSVAVTAAVDGHLTSNQYILLSSNVVSGITANAPISFNGSGGVIGISAAGNVIDGYLTSSNWIEFDAKQATIAVLAPITLTGTSVGITNVSTTVDGYLTSTQFLNMPTDASKGNLSTTATGLSIIGGTNAILGTGCTIGLSAGALATSTVGIYIAGASTSLIGTGADINIATASAAAAGLLSATDWVVFNDKQTSIGALSPITLTGTSVGIINVTSTADGYLTSSQYISIISSGSTLTGVAPIIVGGGSVGVTNVSTSTNGCLTSTQFSLLLGAQRLEMSSANITAGIYTITHSKALAAPYSVWISVFNNNGEQIIPDRIVGSTNTSYLEMTSYGAITGTYGIMFLG